MSIIKRKKQNQFFLFSNHAAQENLVSLNSIGLLAYIVSLPEDWVLHKTFLQNKFTRRTVDSAWNELLEKKYVAGFSCYVDRKKQYYYIASDEELTQHEFDAFVEETFFEIHESTGFVPKNLQVIKDNQFTMDFDFKTEIEKLTESNNLSDARLVHHKEYSTKSTELDEHIQTNTKKEIKQKNNNKDLVVNKENNIGKPINKENFFDITNRLFFKLNDGLYTQQEWNTITTKLFEETIGKDIYNLEKYLEASLTTICNRRKRRSQPVILENNHRPVPFYNWLENR